jgi:transcriptional regulator with XRE-family HTH domain
VDLDPDLVALGRGIRRSRKRSALSQEQLGGEAGLSRNYIGQIERGEREPKAKSLIAIARALGDEAAAWRTIGESLAEASRKLRD